MNTNDTQQEHIYNERIQEFFPLFDKKDDPIYNARVDFNTVKFLTERADWDWNEDKDKNKACGVILQECDKTKKAEQKLESEVKARLKEYVDDVAGVSIYGNHASITLGDDKKEFKISEFLNSDFCEKNGISGFSTLHSDGKSGMHGFVAEEGEKKIRHYVVTDGSYEMTLNWYVNGEKCTIKIKIDKDGVDLTERNGVTAEQLEANKDVKIGGLFLHEIQFRQKEKENEVEHDGQGNQAPNKSFETFIGSDTSKGVSVQATQDQEVESKHATTSTTNSNNASAKKIPPPPPPRTTPEKGVFNKQGGSIFTKSVSQNQDGRQKDERYDNPTFTTFHSEKKGDHQSPSGSSPDSKSHLGEKSMTSSILSDDSGRPLSLVSTHTSEQPLSSPTLNGRNDSGYSSPTHTNHYNSQVNPEQLKKSLEDIEQNGQTPLTEFISKLDEKTQKFPLRPVDQKGMSEQTKDGLLKDNSTGVETVAASTASKQPLSTIPSKSRGDSGFSSPTTDRSQFQVDPEHLTRKLEEEKSNRQKEDKASEEHGKNGKDRNSETHKVPITNPADQVWLKDKVEGRESNQNLDIMEEKLSQTGNIPKDLFSENVLEKIKEGKQYDPVRKLLEKKVAERENNDTNPTVDKNSKLYELLEKDKIQLEVGVIEEAREDTLTEHTDSYDRNRIALGNRNKRPLDWAKRIAEPQQEKDKGILR